MEQIKRKEKKFGYKAASSPSSGHQPHDCIRLLASSVVV